MVGPICLIWPTSDHGCLYIRDRVIVLSHAPLSQFGLTLTSNNMIDISSILYPYIDEGPNKCNGISISISNTLLIQQKQQ